MKTSQRTHALKVSILIVSSLLLTFLLIVFSIYLQPIFAVRVLAVHTTGAVISTLLCSTLYVRLFKKHPASVSRFAIVSFLLYYYTYTFLSAAIVYFSSGDFELFPRCKTTLAEVLTATFTCFFIVVAGGFRKIRNKWRKGNRNQQQE